MASEKPLFQKVAQCYIESRLPVPKDIPVEFQCLIVNALRSYCDDNYEAALNALCRLREDLFPLNSQALLTPEQFDPRFADFILDEGMWLWISKREYNNKEAIEVIFEDLAEMLLTGHVFAN